MAQRVGITRLAAATLAGAWMAGLSIGAAHAEPTKILFVGNSYTHGRYTPALNYNAGPGDAAGGGLVHDLLCPSLPCIGAEGVAPVVPTGANIPGGTLLAQLAYLQANPTKTYTEVGPFGGVAGIFLQLTREAGLDYDVSLIAVSSATLKGYTNNTGNEAGDLPLIESAKYSRIILQDQTFDPLPTTVTVNGQSVPTRGNPTGFQQAVATLVMGIHAADTAAGAPLAAVILAETPPLAAYGYVSTNPAAPIFGSSTPAQQNGNPAYAPYLGDADPMAAMAADLHASYETAASLYNAANPARTPVTVALDGDAWVSAMNLGVAQRNPYLTREPFGQVDLWDSNPLMACCTVPIGYHPSVYGDYLNGLMLFSQITGINPLWVNAEYTPLARDYRQTVTRAFGISPEVAFALAIVAEETLIAGQPAKAQSGLLCWKQKWADCRSTPPWSGHF
jgi:hypothetical protein